MTKEIKNSLEPAVTVIWSESPDLKDGEVMSISEADRLFKRFNDEEAAKGRYYKTKFVIDYVFNGEKRLMKEGRI
ncbi:MAG: hypothetical protein KH297_04650 [Firmicutes bacterium]|nr:hypothetical protein [Bacillota bacterium]